MKRHEIAISTGSQKPLRLFVKTMKRSANAALVNLHADVPCRVDISLVDKEEIQKMNLDNRGIDSVTDVLSFPMLEMKPGLPLSSAVDPYDFTKGRCFLGDVVICYPVALRQAIDYNHSFEREIGFLTVHSVLHLMGYDHMQPGEEEIMLAKTEEVLTSLGLTKDK